MNDRGVISQPPTGLWEGFKRGWMAFAHRLGAINAAILMFLVYFLVLGPVALVAKIFSADPLEQKPTSVPEWISDQDRERDLLERAQRQF